MHSAKISAIILLCVLLSLSGIPVAGMSQDPRSTSATTSDVTIVIQQDKVRFTSQKAVEEMRLQVFHQTGEVVFDSGTVAVPEVSWLLQTAGGEALKSGLYAYTLSIKEPGAETARTRRGHFIVDQAKDRDGKTDKLWITSRNDNGVGAELTVARDEGATWRNHRQGDDRLEGRQRTGARTGHVAVTNTGLKRTRKEESHENLFQTTNL